MKTKLFTTAILSVLFVTSISATPKTEATPNIKEAETTKEWVIVGKERQLDDKKIVYENNAQNQLMTKTVYLQAKNGEWMPYQKYQYDYRSSADSYPASLTYAKWSVVNGEWSESKKINY